MSVFGNYSRYYDLLYRDKDYAGEIAFVIKLIHQFQPNAKRVLELGCGTGKHASLLAEKGYTVYGVDRSETMLEAAHARCKTLKPELQTRLQFSSGDVRNVAVNDTFDVVISLFHVVSYQTTNDDLITMFQNVTKHLKPGGIFIFDYWFGPAVLAERPEVRTKHMESDAIAVERLATPVMHEQDAVVDVNYRIDITDKKTGTKEQLHETHRMRYLFPADIEHFAHAAGFNVTHACEWMTSNTPNDKTWSVCSILTK